MEDFSTRRIGSTFSPCNNLLVAFNLRSIFVYEINNNTNQFTLLENTIPDNLPGNVRSVEFSTCGSHILIGHENSPFLTKYSRNGNVFEKEIISMPSIGEVLDIAHSPCGKHMSVAGRFGANVAIYNINGYEFTFTQDTTSTTILHPVNSTNNYTINRDVSKDLLLTYNITDYRTTNGLEDRNSSTILGSIISSNEYIDIEEYDIVLRDEE